LEIGENSYTSSDESDIQVGTPHLAAGPLQARGRPLPIIACIEADIIGFCLAPVPCLIGPNHDIPSFTRPNDKRRGVLHSPLQAFIQGLAAKYGFEGVSEVPCAPTRIGHSKGLIDVVWFENSRPFIAIEIDNSYKQKSLTKLLESPAPVKLWVFLGREKKLKVVPAGIRVLVVPLPSSSPGALGGTRGERGAP